MRLDVAMRVFDERLSEEPARDTRLVGHDHDGQAGAIQGADRIDGPRIELDAIDGVEVADVHDHRAVAIEEHGRPHRVLRAAPTTAATPMPRMQR